MYFVGMITVNGHILDCFVAEQGDSLMGPDQLTSSSRQVAPKHPFAYKTDPLFQLAIPRLFVMSCYVAARTTRPDVRLTSVPQVRAD